MKQSCFLVDCATTAKMVDEYVRAARRTEANGLKVSIVIFASVSLPSAVHFAIKWHRGQTNCRKHICKTPIH